MAKKMKDETPAKGDNIAGVREEMCSAFKIIMGHTVDRKALHLEHIKPINKEINKAWQTLKGATGMELDELKVFFALYRRQEVGKSFDDEADRVRVADNLRAGFAALVEGGMLDFVDVLENVGQESE